MQYHTLMILVNRPFFAASTATMPEVAFSDPMVGRLACTDSALSISKLLQIYRRLYGLRRINIQAVHLIFTASLIHVLNACEAAEPSLRNSAWRDLEVCLQALSELGKGFQSATRALDVVNGIKNELLKASRVGAKRSAPHPYVAEYDNPTTKRRRPSSGQQSANIISDGINQATHDDTFCGSSLNGIDSIFWSELTSLEFPNF
jgi:hypothetical protein